MGDRIENEYIYFGEILEILVAHLIGLLVCYKFVDRGERLSGKRDKIGQEIGLELRMMYPW
jgi:hypothetical protein